MPRLRAITKDSFTQNLANGRLVVPYLESYDDLDRDWSFEYTPKVHDDAWHPSGDCVPSVSSLYEKATGQTEREKLSPGTQRNFMVGHFWHALIQDILLRLEFCTPEDIERPGKKVWSWSDNPAFARGDAVTESMQEYSGIPRRVPSPYHWAKGSGDVAPLVLPTWRGVFDIKTMAGSMWKQSWKSGLLPSAFADKYECQVNVYMDFFDEEKALILGVNKDAPHGFVEFEFERNQDLIDTIYAKWEYVSFCLDEGIEPDKDADAAFELPMRGPMR